VKLPLPFPDEIERLGKLIVAQDISSDEAADDLEEQTFRREHAPLLHGIVHRFWKAQLKTWVIKYLSSLNDQEEEALSGQAALPFPELAPKIEIAPGRFVHQNAMRRLDWKMAIVQAETKASNANGHVERIKRRAEQCFALLTNDNMTTADIADKLGKVPARA
jgi:hypothetical protein